VGIQGGSLSLCRYRLVGGTGRPNKLAELNGLLEPHKLGPLLLQGKGKEEEVGWVRPVGLDNLNPPPDAPWDLSHAQLDDGFLLRMRLLRRKVPASLLQIVYRQRFFAHEEKTGRAPAPKERRDLRESVKVELLERALPTIAHVDAFWRDREGELMLFSASKKTAETFERLFTASFAGPLGLTVVRIEPPLLGLAFADWDDEDASAEAIGRLSAASPVAFTENLYP
jgi:DNA recombination-dependent growth factor C